MKKIVSFLILMFVASVCAFAQPVYEESPSFPPDLDFSFLKEKFIVSVPNSLGRFEYQNMAGDFLTNKEVKNKVLGIPENEKLVKQYDGFMAATYTLLVVSLASAAVDMIYQFNENLPAREKVQPISRASCLMSFCGIVLTSQAGRLKLRRAVDNYNYYLMTVWPQ